MTNGAAIDGADEGPRGQEGARDGQGHARRRPVASRRTRRSSTTASKVEGSYAEGGGLQGDAARIRELGAPKGTKTAEGFLFPATYELPEGSTANDLVKQQLDAFEENFKSVDMSYAKKQEAHALRRADHRVDDRARGAAGQASARWSRRSSTTGSSRVCR